MSNPEGEYMSDDADNGTEQDDAAETTGEVVDAASKAARMASEAVDEDAGFGVRRTGGGLGGGADVRNG
jgi:hypothetical protein